MRRREPTIESECSGRHPGLRVLLSLLVLATTLGAASCQGPWDEDKRLENPTRILGKRANVIITTDGGRQLEIMKSIPLEKGMTALEALAFVADVRTDQRGRVFQVNGKGPGRLTALGPAQERWFYRINGIESTADPARFKVPRGSSVWWDLRRTDIYHRLPVAAGIFPDSLIIGYRENVRPIRISYGPGFREDAEFFARSVFDVFEPEVRSIREDPDLIGEGHDGPRPALAVRDDRANMVIGRWEDIKADPYIADIAFQPREFGLTIWVEGTDVRRQDPDEEFAYELKDVEGFVWATTIDAEPDSALVYVVSGTTNAGVRAAARALKRGEFQFFLAAAVDRDGAIIP